MIAQRYTFTVVLEEDEEAGGFAVHVPALAGCHTQGDTRKEAIAMARDDAGLTPEQFHELL